MLTSTLRRAIVLCSALVALFVAASAQAATTFVPNRFDDPLIGGTSCTPPAPANGCSLRGAIAAAQTGDTVQLSAGTYQLVFGTLVLPKKITIAGAGPAATTIRQTAQDRVIEIEVGSTMSGLTITGGDLIGQSGADGTGSPGNGEAGEGVSGAGIAAGGPVTLTDIVVTGNQEFGGDGGAGRSGVAVPGSGGRGGFAAGAGISGGNPLALTRVAVTNNLAQPGKAGQGGDAGTTGTGGVGGPGGAAVGAGVSVGFSPLTATDVLIAGNTANATPGGKGGRGGTTSGVGGVGGQGEAAEGGGLFSNGVVKLTNVTIAGNTAAGGTGGTGGAARSIATSTSGGAGGIAFSGAGGAVALFNGAAGQFASVTIAGNTVTKGTGGDGGAGSDGGATGANGTTFANGGGNVFVTSASLAIRGTIIAAGQGLAGTENCAHGSGGTLTSSGHNLEDRNQCIAAPVTGDLANTPAGLGPLADNGGPTQTLALLAGSAAIDAGEPSCVDVAGAPLTTDQRGEPRLSPCDIGAFEVQPVQPPAPTPQGGGANANQAGVGKAVTLSGLKLSPSKLRNKGKATISFNLTGADTVSFTLERRVAGVKAGGKCVARSRKNRQGKACARLVKVSGAPKAVKAPAGTTRLTWKPHGLSAGRYALSATPAGGAATAVDFTVRARVPAAP